VIYVVGPEGFESKNSRKGSRGGLIKAALGLGVVLGGCNAALAATNHLKMADSKKYSYDRDDSPVIPIPFVRGNKLYFSLKPLSDNDKVNPEGFKINQPDLSYKPNKTLTSSEQTLVVDRLSAKKIFCPADASEVKILNRNLPPETPTSSGSSTELDPNKARICMNYGQISLKGESIVVPLALVDIEGAPQKIDETVRSDKCLAWGEKYSNIVNRDVINELNTAGSPTTAGDQFPIIIHMNAENPTPCDTDSVNVITTQR